MFNKTALHYLLITLHIMYDFFYFTMIPEPVQVLSNSCCHCCFHLSWVSVCLCGCVCLWMWTAWWCVSWSGLWRFGLNLCQLICSLATFRSQGTQQPQTHLCRYAEKRLYHCQTATATCSGWKRSVFMLRQLCLHTDLCKANSAFYPPG